ncbi:hypothetical protein GCM10009821_26370 [Aeromicrobium halocynthiae]|uniref:Site-specific integrase n=1 Tax=Aeromicrobium halocynthiae TaxID=560557 RepID=A0ABN2W528_9ACTN
MNAAERHARLMSYQPQLPAAEANALREQVVDLVTEVDFTSIATDSVMISSLFRLAAVMCREYGSFMPGIHLSEPALASYAQRHLQHVTVTSRASTLAALRRIRNRRPLVNTNARAIAGAPYSPGEWDLITEAALTCGEWKSQALLMLTLAEHAALRSEEVAHAEASWVVREHGRVCIRVPRATGEFRRVPLAGEHADRALAARRDGSYLLRPTFVKRSDAASSLKALVVKNRKDFSFFSIPRARNTRIVELMKVPAPWPVISTFAGLTKGQTHYIGDLVRHVGVASEAEMLSWMDQFEGGAA